MDKCEEIARDKPIEIWESYWGRRRGGAVRAVGTEQGVMVAIECFVSGGGSRWSGVEILVQLGVCRWHVWNHLYNADLKIKTAERNLSGRGTAAYRCSASEN